MTPCGSFLISVEVFCRFAINCILNHVYCQWYCKGEDPYAVIEPLKEEEFTKFVGENQGNDDAEERQSSTCRKANQIITLGAFWVFAFAFVMHICTAKTTKAISAFRAFGKFNLRFYQNKLNTSFFSV